MRKFFYLFLVFAVLFIIGCKKNQIINNDEINTNVNNGEEIIVYHTLEFYIEGVLYYSNQYEKGKTILLNLPEKEYYHLVFTQLCPNIMPDNDVKVEAFWELDKDVHKFELTIDEDTYSSRWYREGEKIEITLPTKDHYHLVLDNEIPELMEKENVIIKGNFVIDIYTLIINYNDGPNTIDVIKYGYGTIIERPDKDKNTIFKKTGYVFIDYDKEFPFALFEDTTINGIWKAEKFIITFDGSNADYLEFNKAEIDYGEYLALPKISKNNFEFLGWYYENNKITDGLWQPLNYTQEVTLKARFKYLGDTVEFGVYPQTHINDIDLIDKLNSLTDKDSRGYYEYNGNYYCKILATPVVENALYYSDGCVIVKADEWFKVEPITWKIVKNTNSLFTPLYLLDTTYYSESECESYTTSHLRSYLNSTFIMKAFKGKDIPNLNMLNYKVAEYIVNGNSVVTRIAVVKDYVMCCDVNVCDFERVELTDYAIARGADVCVSTNTDTNITKYYGNYWMMESYIQDTLKVKQTYYKAQQKDVKSSNGNVIGKCIRPYIGLSVAYLM